MKRRQFLRTVVAAVALSPLLARFRGEAMPVVLESKQTVDSAWTDAEYEVAFVGHRDFFSVPRMNRVFK